MLGPPVSTQFHQASYPRFAHDGGIYFFHKKIDFQDCAIQYQETAVHCVYADKKYRYI